jgi:hypothetical protein
MRYEQPGDQAAQRADILATVKGRQKKENEETTYICASSQKKYVRTFFFFLVRFWAFLGKGSSKTRGKKMSTFQKKSPGKYFSGGDFFSW